MAVFKDIYQEYGKPVYHFLLSLTGDRDLAEELLQETFYQAFIHIDGFEGRSSVYTWLCRIGKNAWLKECQRRRRFDENGTKQWVSGDGQASPEDEIIRRDEYQRIRRAVYHLEEPYREVFVMHIFGGLKLKEIAALSGKTESWARVTYYRAKKRVIEEVQI